MTVTKLLLVDDHPLFRDGFAEMARVLRGDWEMLFAGSAGDACDILAITHDIAAILIDINLPDRDGFALVRESGERWPELPCILISGREDLAAFTRARADGARGFIAKSDRPDMIVARIDVVLAGGTTFDPPGPMSVPTLTTRQSQVLELLCDGHGNKEIRYRLGIAERTVRAHLTELFQLLGAHSRGQAVVKARAMGLIP